MNTFIATARTAIMKAGAILRAGFLKKQTLHYKHSFHQAIVTAVDLASEHIIRRIIHRAYPTHAIVGEEKGLMNGARSPYLWIIDPVDGTSNYAHGMPMFNVTIALQKNGQTILGMVYQPVTCELFVAVRGRGAWLNDIRTHVSKQTVLTKTYGFIEWLPEDPRINKMGMKIFSQLRAHHVRVRNIGCGALVFSYVGAGRCEYAISVDSQLWDVAAASLFIEEAGGRVTDFDGKNPEHVWRDDPFGKCPLLATNGKMHRPLLRLVQK